MKYAPIFSYTGYCFHFELQFIFTNRYFVIYLSLHCLHTIYITWHKNSFKLKPIEVTTVQVKNR